MINYVPIGFQDQQLRFFVKVEDATKAGTSFLSTDQSIKSTTNCHQF